MACAAGDLDSVPLNGCKPVRRFAWRRRQRHRPGPQFMVSTGRLHGFESLEERSLLLALDFTGMGEEVLPQPFLLRFRAAAGEFRRHVPDFLAVFRDGSRWLFDVRPAELVEEEDATCFAAGGAVEGRRPRCAAACNPRPRAARNSARARARRAIALTVMRRTACRASSGLPPRPCRCRVPRPDGAG